MFIQDNTNVHKLQTLVIQNMLMMGESRDMSGIYIALQG